LVIGLPPPKKWSIEWIMTAVTLKAHFDGEKICLDEPFELKPNTPLLVAVPGPDENGDERADWIAIARKALARAYGEDEPDYPSDLIREKPSK
jgi:hypothetical protein